MLLRGKRRAARVAIAGGFATAVVGGCLALTSGVASASGGCGTEPSDNNVYIDCALPSATPSTVYSDGQSVDLSMGANSLFNGTVGASIEAIECEYNNGTGGLGDPPNANFCSAGTLAGDFPYNAHANGSFDYTADNPPSDQVTTFALPGRSFKGASIICNATHPCVWYVGEDYNDFADFPHVFSNPFFVHTSPVVNSGNAATFVENAAGNFQVTTDAASDPASSFSESGALPSGVTLSPSGHLSGSPALGTSGSYPITITANNGALPNGTQSFTLTVIPLTITETQSEIPTAHENVLYGPINFSASGGNTAKGYKWKMTGGSLPKGIKFKNGVLAGTANPKKASPGTYSFQVTVSTKKFKEPGTKPPVIVPAASVSMSFTLTLQS